MTLSELVLEYVRVSKHTDAILSSLKVGIINESLRQHSMLMEERLSEFQREFRKHGLHVVALECAITEKQLNDLRLMLIANPAA